ncbi:MAG: hypothetical protein AAGC85_15960 [Bacteroidota bacterium]
MESKSKQNILGAIWAFLRGTKRGYSQENYVVEKENAAKVVATFFAWWKSDITPELAYGYWRDVHGPWASRTPGFYQYRQLYLNHLDPTLLSGLQGIDLDIPSSEQPNGIANIFYSSRFMANLLRKPFAKKIADKDDVYFVSRNTYQRASLPISKTFVDKLNTPEQNGPLKNPRYLLAFKKKDEMSSSSFGEYLVSEFCEPWSKYDHTKRLRVEVLTLHENEPTSPNGVSHTWPEEEQYHAWIEIELSEGINLSSLFDSSKPYGSYLRSIHAYPIREIYTFVFDGKPTLVGLRGYQAASTVESLHADFQKSKRILKSLYKKDMYRREG